MPTCADVIKTALQHLGAINPVESPNAEQLVAGMAALQTWYDGLVEKGTLGRLTDVLITEDYEAGENERIAFDGTGTIPVTLPVTITDADTGLDRAPLDLALVVVSGEGSHIYDALAGGWVALGSLVSTDDAPLSARFDIPAILACNWPFYSRYLTPSVERMAARTMLAVVSKNLSPRVETQGAYF